MMHCARANHEGFGWRKIDGDLRGGMAVRRRERKEVRIGSPGTKLGERCGKKKDSPTDPAHLHFRGMLEGSDALKPAASPDGTLVTSRVGSPTYSCVKAGIMPPSMATCCRSVASPPRACTQGGSSTLGGAQRSPSATCCHSVWSPWVPSSATLSTTLEATARRSPAEVSLPGVAVPVEVARADRLRVNLLVDSPCALVIGADGGRKRDGLLVPPMASSSPPLESSFSGSGVSQERRKDILPMFFIHLLKLLLPPEPPHASFILLVVLPLHRIGACTVGGAKLGKGRIRVISLARQPCTSPNQERGMTKINQQESNKIRVGHLQIAGTQPGDASPP